MLCFFILQGLFCQCFKVLSHYFSYVCGHTCCHGTHMEVSRFSLFTMWLLQTGLGWVVRPGGKCLRSPSQTHSLKKDMSYINYIATVLVLMSFIHYIASVLALTSFIHYIDSVLVLMHPLVCIKHNFENPMAMTRGVNSDRYIVLSRKPFTRLLASQS